MPEAVIAKSNKFRRAGQFYINFDWRNKYSCYRISLVFLWLCLLISRSNLKAAWQKKNTPDVR